MTRVLCIAGIIGILLMGSMTAFADPKPSPGVDESATIIIATPFIKSELKEWKIIIVFIL